MSKLSKINDQQTSHANDTSLRFVATLQDKEIIWGKA